LEALLVREVGKKRNRRKGETGEKGKDGREREGKEKGGQGALNDFLAGARNLKLRHCATGALKHDQTNDTNNRSVSEL